MRKQSITRKDVALRAGVSVATVSYVINGGPRPVADETREVVLRAIRELDYTPLEAARSLRYQRTRTIGLLLADTANPFYATLAKSIEESVFAHGWSVLLCNSGYDASRTAAYVEVLISKQVDGVLYVPGTTDSAAVTRLVKRGIPMVVIDRAVPGEEVDCVVADNLGGTKAAMNYLLSLGHRHIGMIVRYSSLSNAERIQGYEAVLAQAGIEMSPALFVEGGFGFEEGRRAMRQLLGLDPAPTAVLAFPDVLAIGAIRAVLDAGLHLPEDISIIGFDDIPVASHTYPALTTVAMPTWEMGKRAAEMLLNRIFTTEEIRPPERIVLPTRLIIRESTGAVKQPGRGMMKG